MITLALFKRGGIFWAYYWINGRRHAQSTGTGIRRQAEAIARHFKEELNLQRLGIVQPQPELTFGELAAVFLAEGSPRAYHIDRLKPLLGYWENIAIGRINKAKAKEYRDYRHAEKKQLSHTTINRDLEVLRKILSWAVEQGYLATNPLSRVFMAEERRKPRLMVSVAEEDKLLQAAAPHLRSIIVAALDTGMRRGEILAQRWEHVDFTRRLLYVSHSKTVGGEARELVLTERLFQELDTRKQSDGTVFTFGGEPIHRIKTAWKGAIRRAGIRYFRFHDLRHAHNTRLLEAGVSAEVRRALMGHSTGRDTNAIYTHVTVQHKREAIQKLETWAASERKRLQDKEEADERERTSRNDRGDPERGVPERQNQ